MESALIIAAFGGAYWWARQPALQPYSLQLTALLFVIYFLGKRLARARWLHIFPSGQGSVIETALLLAGAAILIGHTGALTSPFLPILFLIMFVSVLTLHISSLLVELVSLLVFLWAVSAQPWTIPHLITWLSFPLLTPLMFFARWQWEDARRSQQQAAVTAHELSRQEKTIQLFLTTYLKPKLQLIAASLASERNLEMARKQITLLQDEVDHTIREIDDNTSS